MYVPALCRHLSDCVSPIAQQAPECLWVMRPSRKPAAHPNDGDRFVLGLLDGIEFRLLLFQSRERVLQQSSTVRLFRVVTHFPCLLTKRVAPYIATGEGRIYNR